MHFNRMVIGKYHAASPHSQSWTKPKGVCFSRHGTDIGKRDRIHHRVTVTVMKAAIYTLAAILPSIILCHARLHLFGVLPSVLTRGLMNGSTHVNCTKQRVTPYQVSKFVANVKQALVEAGDHAAVGQLFERLFHLCLVDGAAAAERVPTTARSRHVIHLSTRTYVVLLMLVAESGVMDNGAVNTPA